MNRTVELTDDGGPEVADVHLFGDVRRGEVDDDALPSLGTFQVVFRGWPDAVSQQNQHLKNLIG